MARREVLRTGARSAREHGGARSNRSASGYQPETILLNYYNYFGGPPWFHTQDGIPVLNSQQRNYADGPAEVAAQISELVALPPDQRPLLTFINLTVWENTYDELADELAPLLAQGVRLLSPGEVQGCLPAPPPAPTTTTSATAPGPTASASPNSTSAAQAQAAANRSGQAVATGVGSGPRFVG